jgi:hypothetical protein
MQVSGAVPRCAPTPWESHVLAATRSTRVGREARVSPDAGPLALYLSAFPTRRVDWDRKRQLFVITDRRAPGWREFVLEWVKWPDPVSETDDVELQKVLGHLPQLIDEGDRYFGSFAPLSYAYVHKRMRERQEFHKLGSNKYAESIAAKNRAIGKRRIRATALNNAARLNEIRRWFPVLSGTGEKIPLVPGFSFTQ